MLRKRRCETQEDAMHAEMTAILARQHVADLHAEADRRRRQHRRARRRRRASLRTRLGWTLVRWGHRLAPPPRIVVHRHRPATMGS
jgi:hypothetical protein